MVNGSHVQQVTEILPITSGTAPTELQIRTQEYRTVLFWWNRIK